MARERSVSSSRSAKRSKSRSASQSSRGNRNNGAEIVKDRKKKNAVNDRKNRSSSRSRSESSSSNSSRSSSRPRRSARRGRSDTRSSSKRRGRRYSRSPPVSKPKPLPAKPRSPSPATVLHVSNLSRNVKAGHLQEIFGYYGKIAKVELAVDKKVNLPKGYAFVEFLSRTDAEQAQLYLDGGQLDGNYLKVAFILFNKRKEKKVSPPPPPNRSRDNGNRGMRPMRPRSPLQRGNRRVGPNSGRFGSGLGTLRRHNGPQKSYAELGMKRDKPRHSPRPGGRKRLSRSPVRRRSSRSRSRSRSRDRKNLHDKNRRRSRSYSGSVSRSASEVKGRSRSISNPSLDKHHRKRNNESPSRSPAK